MTQGIGRVARIWRYPVKSLRGERLDVADIESRGLAGDRRFAVRTQTDRGEKIGSGKTTRRFQRIDGLLALAARLGDDGVPLIEAGGDWLRADAAETSALLSARLGRKVTLTVETDVSHFDAGPLHLVTEATLDWLRRRTPGVITDDRRLRPNIVLDAGTTALIEEEWIGRYLALGGARVRVVSRTERCVMLTYAQAELAKAPQLLRTVVRENAAHLGVYAEVVDPGTVSVGDPVQVSER